MLQLGVNCPLRLGSYPPTVTYICDRDAILMITFRRDVSQVLRKILLGHEVDKKAYLVFKDRRNNLYHKLSKVNVLRKR